ncbi:unnamed protein product [Owenia fusiformis]|uniref:protein-tyrosine-phosphatase n=1 Tax=Owenia fusiformis TaxID=6347 RepID=A0A8J1TA74_OWEFU|nr:unnamed protein product [Owenia fusiformis]
MMVPTTESCPPVKKKLTRTQAIVVTTIPSTFATSNTLTTKPSGTRKKLLRTLSLTSDAVSRTLGLSSSRSDISFDQHNTRPTSLTLSNSASYSTSSIATESEEGSDCDGGQRLKVEKQTLRATKSNSSATDRRWGKPPRPPNLDISRKRNNYQNVTSPLAKTVLKKKNSSHILGSFTVGGGSTENPQFRKSISYSSCPNLLDDDKHLEQFDIISKSKHHKRKSPSHTPKNMSPKVGNSPVSSPCPSPNSLLKVPDIFTTSYTRSNSMPRGSSNHGPGRKDSWSASPIELSPKHRDLLQSVDTGTDLSGLTISARVTKGLSVPNLFDTPDSPIVKELIKKCYSDTPPKTRSDSDGNPNVFYRDSNCAQIMEHLFLGNIESAHNERLLCKLKIDGIIDIANVDIDDIPAEKRLSCPCSCPISRHSRPKLYINVDDNELADMEPYFDEINRFIEGTRKRNKRVLVHSYFGKSRAVTALVQYIMKMYNLPLKTAYNVVRKARPEINVNPRFQRLLEALNQRLTPGGRDKFRFDDVDVSFGNVKEAWSDV